MCELVYQVGKDGSLKNQEIIHVSIIFSWFYFAFLWKYDSVGLGRWNTFFSF